MSVNVDNVFMEERLETLENIKDRIKLEFNIQESGKLKKFLGAYYAWVHDAKGPYKKVIMEKDVNKLVERYNKFTGSESKVQKTHGAPGTTLREIKLKHLTEIDKYMSLLGQII